MRAPLQLPFHILMYIFPIVKSFPRQPAAVRDALPLLHGLYTKCGPIHIVSS